MFFLYMGDKTYHKLNNQSLEVLFIELESNIFFIVEDVIQFSFSQNLFKIKVIVDLVFIVNIFCDEFLKSTFHLFVMFDLVCSVYIVFLVGLDCRQSFLKNIVLFFRDYFLQEIGLSLGEVIYNLVCSYLDYLERQK